MSRGGDLRNLCTEVHNNVSSVTNVGAARARWTCMGRRTALDLGPGGSVGGNCMRPRATNKWTPLSFPVTCMNRQRNIHKCSTYSCNVKLHEVQSRTSMLMSEQKQKCAIEEHFKPSKPCEVQNKPQRVLLATHTLSLGK